MPDKNEPPLTEEERSDAVALICRGPAGVARALRNEREKLAEAKSSHEHSVYWYGTRFDALRDWAKGLGDKLFTEFCSLVANGVPDVFSTHRHAVNYNRLKYHAEKAEAALAEERDRSKRIEAEAAIMRQCLEQIKAEEVARMVGDGILKHSIAENGPQDGTKFTSRVLDLTKQALRSTPPEAAKP